MMVYCPRCGKENDDDAAYCTGCGAEMAEDDEGFLSDVDQRAQRFAQDMEAFGRKVGAVAERAARQFAEEVERITRSESTCPRCGETFSGRRNYCSQCGSEIP